MQNNLDLPYTSVMGRKKDDSDRVTLSLRIPKELHDRLTAEAQAGYRPITQQIILCLEHCLKPSRIASGASLTADPKEPYNPNQ